MQRSQYKGERSSRSQNYSGGLPAFLNSLGACQSTLFQKWFWTKRAKMDQQKLFFLTEAMVVFLSNKFNFQVKLAKKPASMLGACQRRAVLPVILLPGRSCCWVSRSKCMPGWFCIFRCTSSATGYCCYILGISRAYLGHILGISSAYLRHILGISWGYLGHLLAYLRNVFGIFWGYLKDILGISLGYLEHILGIYKAYFWHSLGISLA